MHSLNPDPIPVISLAELKKFSIGKIKKRLAELQNKTDEIKSLLKEVSDPATKGVLNLQMSIFSKSINVLHKELFKRQK